MYNLCVRFFVYRPLCGLSDGDFCKCGDDAREARHGRWSSRRGRNHPIHNLIKLFKDPKPTASSLHALINRVSFRPPPPPPPSPPVPTVFIFVSFFNFFKYRLISLTQSLKVKICIFKLQVRMCFFKNA
jgi:hypothetical protein